MIPLIIDVEKYKQEADKLDALLCSLCEYVEKGGTTHDVESWPASVRKWWKDNKRKDEERRAEEHRLQLRRDDNAKLTPEEWCKYRKRKDEERKAKEQAEERRLQLRSDALAKLTPEERKVLGV